MEVAPVVKAIKKGNINKIRSSMSNDFDINAQIGNEKLTIPMLAIFNNKPNILNEILCRKLNDIDFMMTNAEDLNLLRYCIHLNQINCFKIILDIIHNDLLNNRNKKKHYVHIIQNALNYATESNKNEFISLIDDHKGAPVYELSSNTLLSRQRSSFLHETSSSSPYTAHSESSEPGGVPSLNLNNELAAAPSINYSASTSVRSSTLFAANDSSNQSSPNSNSTKTTTKCCILS